MHTGGDTTRFRGMWLVDFSHRNTVVRALMGRGKIFKRWPVRGYKRVGDHCFILFLSNTSCRYKRLFGTPVAFSVMCSLWKMRPIVLDLLPTFCELMIEGDLKLWWFPERSHSSTNKYSHFRGLQKVITFEWYPTIVAEKLGYFNKWRLFGAPLIWLPPKRLLWIRHWTTWWFETRFPDHLWKVVCWLLPRSVTKCLFIIAHFWKQIDVKRYSNLSAFKKTELKNYLMTASCEHRFSISRKMLVSCTSKQV